MVNLTVIFYISLVNLYFMYSSEHHPILESYLLFSFSLPSSWNMVPDFSASLIRSCPATCIKWWPLIQEGRWRVWKGKGGGELCLYVYERVEGRGWCLVAWWRLNEKASKCLCGDAAADLWLYLVKLIYWNKASFTTSASSGTCMPFGKIHNHWSI